MFSIQEEIQQAVASTTDKGLSAEFSRLTKSITTNAATNHTTSSPATSSSVSRSLSSSSSLSNSESNCKKLNILITVNRAYQEAIDDKLEKLKKLLKDNIEKQNELFEKISHEQNQAMASAGESNVKLSTKYEKELNRIKGNYFKDRFNSIPEDNAETVIKNKLAFYDHTPQLKAEWTLEYRNKLRSAILTDAIRILKTPFKNKIAVLEEKLAKLRTSDVDRSTEVCQVQKTLRQTASQLKKIDSYPDDNILNTVDFEKIDWWKISKVDLNGYWSSTECRLLWVNVCQPRVNQTKWTQAESDRLIELARKYRERNWEQIAVELNTNRSAFLCMKRYHEKTAEKYCRRDWSDEELKELANMAETHRIGLFVPFNFLCYLNGSRDRATLCSTFFKIDPYLNHGKWNASEDQAFDEAIRFFTARNWQEISEYVGTRTAGQCKERYEQKYLFPEKYVNWTREDDKLLMDLVDEYGGQWAKIAAYHFPNRSDHSCLFRYQRIMQWKKKNEWFDSQAEEIREFILFLFRGKRLPKKRAHKAASKNDDDSSEQASRSEQNELADDEDEYDDQEQLYTNKGELVPAPPKFSAGAHYLANVVEKIYEKKDLVYEFIHKKREGQLSLSLLTKIGIYTPVLNNLIKRYKNMQLKMSKKKEKVRKKREEKPDRSVKRTPRVQKSKKIKDTLNLPIEKVIRVNMKIKGDDTTTTTPRKRGRPKSNKILNEINNNEASTSSKKKSAKVKIIKERKSIKEHNTTVETVRELTETIVDVSQDIIYDNHEGETSEKTEKPPRINKKAEERPKAKKIRIIDEGLTLNEQLRLTNEKKIKSCITKNQKYLSQIEPKFDQTLLPPLNEPIVLKKLKINQIFALKEYQQTTPTLLNIRTEVSPELDFKRWSKKTPKKTVKSTQVETNVTPNGEQTTFKPTETPIPKTRGRKRKVKPDETDTTDVVSTPRQETTPNIESASKQPKTPKRSYKKRKLADYDTQSQQSDQTQSSTEPAKTDKNLKNKKIVNNFKKRPNHDIPSISEVVSAASPPTALPTSIVPLPSNESPKATTQTPQPPPRMEKNHELIVNLDSIEDGTKIPCLTECINEFRYSYSLKKDKDSLKYLNRYKIINCCGNLVAVKPLYGSIKKNYLTEKRINAIQKTLNKVLNF